MSQKKRFVALNNHAPFLEKQGKVSGLWILSHLCLKAGDSSIRSWGAFGSLLRFVSLDSAKNGGDCARPVFTPSLISVSKRGLLPMNPLR